MIATGNSTVVQGFQVPLPDLEEPPAPQAALGGQWPPAADRVVAAPPIAAAPSAAPPADPFGGEAGSLAGFLSTIEGVFSQLASMVAGILGSATGSAGAPVAKPAFTSATLSSTGDPHDTFSGTTSAGTTSRAAWNDMQSHADLFSSDSFSGGLRVATTVSAPNAKGATMNQDAEVITDGGKTSVRLDADGSYSVTSGGKPLTLATGVAADLGNGETVTRRDDGALAVEMTNATGGSVSTTLSANGQGGVDVNASARDVDLAGYLVDDAGSSSPVRPRTLVR